MRSELIPNYLEKKFTHDELNAIRKSIIIPNWNKIADSREIADGKKIYYLLTEMTHQRYGTSYTEKCLFLDVEGKNYSALRQVGEAYFQDILKEDTSWGSNRYISSSSIRDGWLHDGSLEMLIRVSIDRLGLEQFDLLYKKVDVDAQVAKQKKNVQKAKAKRLEKRAAKFTNPGQKEIVRHAAMLLINQAIQDAGLPFQLTTDIRGMRDSVFFNIRPTEPISKDSLFYKLFKARDYYVKDRKEQEFDETGEELYNSFVEGGFDMDSLLRLMVTDNSSEHVRQFGVVFGEQIALGAIDRNPIIRHAAKLKMTKKKEQAAVAESYKKAFQASKEISDDSEAK